MRWINTWGAWALGLLTSSSACAPSPKTVANVTTGITGCPTESLVVFNYVKATRTWSAACGEKLYVCSDGRGPARCTPQQTDTVDQERAVRAKALSQLSPAQRSWFVDRDISQGDWASFAQLVATAKAMSDAQLETIDPATVYSAGSAELDRAVRACAPKRNVIFQVDAGGRIRAPYSQACAIAIANRPELEPLRRRVPTTVALLPGVFDIKPIARPVLVAAAAPTTATAPVPAAPEAASASAPSPELDAAVRQWLDKARAGIIACTGKDPSALLVSVDAEGKPEVSIRDGAPEAPEAGCVRSALGAPPTLPPGPARILHVVKSAP